MKLFLTCIFLLPLLLAQAQDDNGGCPAGYEPVENPPGSGNIECHKVVIVCPGTDRNYVDAETNANLCCPVKQELVIFDDTTRIGACCGVGQSYVGKAPDGKCCTTGQILVDDKCTDPPPGAGCETCPMQPPGACALQAACGDSTYNGLEYGHCYQITFPDGHQLGRGISLAAADQYCEDGYVQNIPYMICKTTTNCGTGPVANTDPFYIGDTVGPALDTTGQMGWDNAAGGAHMSLTIDPTKAGVFRGKMSCSSCKCVVQLSGNPGGIGQACPMTQPGITFWPNPNVGLDMQFAEVPCNGDFGTYDI